MARVADGVLTRHNDVAKAIDYMLKRWAGFIRFLDDGKICLSNNAAERALRGVAVGRRNRLFAGSDRGGDLHPDRQRQAATSIRKPGLKTSCVGSPINPASQLAELLPWNWQPPAVTAAAA